ncbi:DDHD domain-containing protein [Tirmania nivea]|nr:DDHD domain-containing protein [Tirmania nivea]
MTAPPPPSPPPLIPWWFYTSPLPLDDPLSPLPITTSATSSIKHPPRPFSHHDTRALEKAYQSLLVSDAPRTDSCGVGNGNNSVVHKGTGSVDPHPSRHLRHHRAVTEQQEYAEEGRGHDMLNAPIRPGKDEKSPPRTMVDNRQRRRSSSPEVNPWTGNPIRSRTSDYSSAGSSPSTTGMDPPPRITTNPFIRSLSLSRRNQSRSTSPGVNRDGVKRRRSSPMSAVSSTGASPEREVSPPPVKQKEIPVGIQRLHKVLLPSLTMAPIYWSPVHDVSGVCRGTWFYRDTMLPVETDMANRLERGYCEVRAWTEEWDAELESAVQVGREGEEKIRWKLWDMKGIDATNTPLGGSRPGTSTGKSEPMDIGSGRKYDMGRTSTSAIPNPNDWVIFANSKEAYICRDTMLGFGNRRPLATIRSAGASGASNVGIRVVRGFDVTEWERLNPKRKITGRGKKEQGNDDWQKVSDLILVIHGIGQKLSERVESFHFTHSINSFRRSMNMELRDPAVAPHLRESARGMMVLPVNWRMGLSFEDGMGPAKAKKKNNYTLENITLPTIPAVRNLIGDVMLDIPYYLSHTHKHKMIDAVVREANRIYGLWKMHNPGWEENGGRVHLIAHSLGSAIALDVLSRQPTYIADWRKEQELKANLNMEIRTSQDLSHAHHKTPGNASEQNFFDFDTSNLYCAGSPAGFFLLLNRGMLLPRPGRRKPDTPPDVESDSRLFGEQGTYGCLAVDNIYNVMHYSDPIAYRLNPTVDVEYAENLKIQPIPSATSTLFESIGSTLRSVLPGGSTANTNPALPADAVLSPPPPNLTRLPSTIELETHDFSREEIAEKRMYLLNDNGTMDWYVGSSGGWVLENQYLNMLGAHSSYWESRDFVRFVVTESGRRLGRTGVRPDVRAVKVRGAR